MNERFFAQPVYAVFNVLYCLATCFVLIFGDNIQPTLHLEFFACVLIAVSAFLYFYYGQDNEVGMAEVFITILKVDWPFMLVILMVYSINAITQGTWLPSFSSVAYIALVPFFLIMGIILLALIIVAIAAFILALGIFLEIRSENKLPPITQTI